MVLELQAISDEASPLTKEFVISTNSSIIMETLLLAYIVKSIVSVEVKSRNMILALYIIKFLLYTVAQTLYLIFH